MELIIILIASATLFASALIRVFILHVPLPFPHNFLLFLIGVCTGLFIEYAQLQEYVNLGSLNPIVLLDVIVPVIMFEAAFFIHQETFRISFIQVASLVFLHFGFSVTFIGLVVTRLFEYGWTWNHAVILCCIITMPSPILTMAFLKRLSAPFKIQLFLELEALLGNCATFVVFKCAVLYHVIKEGAILPVYVLGIIVAPVIGIIISKAVAYWLSRIIKDSVNEICIVVASVYMCYLFANFLRVSGIIAVVAMGISMTGKRSFMGEGTEKFLIRFLHVMSTFFNSNMILVCGLQAVTVIKPSINVEDVQNIIIVFCLLNAVRISVILMLSPLLLYTGNCLSWNNILVICLCNIRGAVSILMSLCLLHKDLKIFKAEKMFVQSLGQIVLSLLINSVITNTVIRYEVFIGEDESKSSICQKTKSMLDNLRQNTIAVFKHHNKFIADADWSIVEKFTQIHHPLLDSGAFKGKNVYPESRDPKKWEKQAIERILTMMKCSYLNQYKEGLLSRHAVKGVLHWSRQALAKGTSLIFPSKVESALKIPHHLQFMKQELWLKLRELVFLERNMHYLGVTIRAFVIFLHFFDVTITVMQMANEIFIHNKRHRTVFFWYNLTYITFHIVLLVFRYSVKRVMTLWEAIILLIVPFGIVDLMATHILTTDEVVFNFIIITLTASRFFRILQIGEVCPTLIKMLIEFCEAHIRQHLSEGYDIGRSYIRGRQEVMRRLTNGDLDLSEDVLSKYATTCRQHKLEATRMMGYLQMQHPVVSTSAKTRQAMRITLKSQLEKLRHLQRERAIGHQDGASLEKKIYTKLAKVNMQLLIITPPSNDEIIFTVPWISNNPDLFKFIKAKGRKLLYNPGDVIVTQMYTPRGISIILDGIAVMEKILSKPNGAHKEVLTDYLLSGNVIGEYSFLTGKASHKTIVCETHVMIWFIRYQHLWKYIREMPGYRKDLLSTLQLKMWKVVAVKLAFRILLNEPSWFRMSRTEIMRELSEAILVDLRTSHHSLAEFLCSSDVIVIQGTMVANGPNQIIRGPFCIARGQTNYCFAEDSERPVILVMPPEVEDDYESKIQIGMWCTTDEEVGERTVSDLTLSSGTSNEQPSYKSRKVYFLCRDCAVRESHSSVSICSWVIGPETEV